MTKEELNQRLLHFNPGVIFAGTSGGIKLIMEVDAFNEYINWSVQEGDHYTVFEDFNKARDYYLEAIGVEENM